MSIIRQLPKPLPVLVTNTLVSFGERMAIARKARELTQTDLARLADVGLSTVVSLEGGHGGVSFGNALKVLKALDLLGQVDGLLLPANDPALVSFAERQLSR